MSTPQPLAERLAEADARLESLEAQLGALAATEVAALRQELRETAMAGVPPDKAIEAQFRRLVLRLSRLGAEVIPTHLVVDAETLLLIEESAPPMNPVSARTPKKDAAQ